MRFIRFIRPIVLSTVATLCLVTCSGGTNKVSLEDFIDQTVSLTCEQTLACTPPDVLELLSGVTTVQGCMAAAALGQANYRTALRAALDAGKIAFYPDRAEACLAAFSAAGCGDTISECTTARPIEGKVGASATCDATIAECLPSLYCKAPSNCTVGTCTAAAQSGTACSADKACDLGLRCTNGTCADTHAVGDGCTADADCASSYCGDDQKCHALGDLPDLGEVCKVKGAMSVTCWKGYCKQGATVGEGTCTAFPRLNDPCGGANLSYCIGAFCDLAAANPVCTAFKATGQNCTSHGQCISRYCDTTCKAKQANNTDCTASVQCLSGICDAGKCAADACP